MHVNIQTHTCLEQDAPPTYRPKACVNPITRRTVTRIFFPISQWGLL